MLQLRSPSLFASSEYVAASHRLDAVLNDAAQIRGQKRAAPLEILSNKRSLGADLVESSLAFDAAQASSAAATSLSVSEVCDGTSYRFGPISLPVSTVLH